MKQKKLGKSEKYEDITLPKNTPMGIFVAGFVFLIGFALVWHIIWLGVVGLVGAITCVIIRTLDDETEYVLPAAEVAKIATIKMVIAINETAENFLFIIF